MGLSQAAVVMEVQEARVADVDKADVDKVDVEADGVVDHAVSHASPT